MHLARGGRGRVVGYVRSLWNERKTHTLYVRTSRRGRETIFYGAIKILGYYIRYAKYGDDVVFWFFPLDIRIVFRSFIPRNHSANCIEPVPLYPPPFDVDQTNKRSVEFRFVSICAANHVNPRGTYKSQNNVTFSVGPRLFLQIDLNGDGGELFERRTSGTTVFQTAKIKRKNNMYVYVIGRKYIWIIVRWVYGHWNRDVH